MLEWTPGAAAALPPTCQPSPTPQPASPCSSLSPSCRSGSPEAVDRDANIALFQEAAATRSGGTSSSSSTSGGSTGSGVERFLLVATFEGRQARASVPMQRCAGAGRVAADAGRWPGCQVRARQNACNQPADPCSCSVPSLLPCRAKEAAVDYIEEMAGEHGIRSVVTPL